MCTHGMHFLLRLPADTRLLRKRVCTQLVSHHVQHNLLHCILGSMGLLNTCVSIAASACLLHADVDCVPYRRCLRPHKRKHVLRLWLWLCRILTFQSQSCISRRTFHGIMSVIYRRHCRGHHSPCAWHRTMRT